MSSPEKRTTRRSARKSPTREPKPAVSTTSGPSLVFQHSNSFGLEPHPDGEGKPPKPSPPKSAPPRRAAAAAKKGSGAAGGSGRGGATAAVLVALLAVGGSVWYSQVHVKQQQQPAAAGSAAEAPRKQQRREPTTLLEAAIEPIPQPVPPAPPLPPLTREEEAAFEQAAWEHYGMPPGSQPGHGVVLQRHTNQEVVLERSTAASTSQEAAHATQQEPEAQLGGSGEEAAEIAAATFDPAVHQRYLDLPPWPPTTHAELTGSWNLTEHIYDYAASLPMVQVLSRDEPRLVLFPSFLTPEEVGHMVTMSRERLERSEVLVAEGEENQSDVRTSFGFWPDEDEVTRRITERIHRTIGIPAKFGEGLYVLNYQLGQKYEAHNDHCMDGYLGNRVAEPACLDFLKRAGGPECGPGKGGPTCGDRVATFIMYLKSPAKGGTTAFPDAAATKEAMGGEHRSGNSPDDWYCREPRALAAAPPAGTGVLFWDYRPGNGAGTGSYEDGTAEPVAQTVYAAMHSGCPVVEGEKYVMTRWIRGAGFDVPRP